LQSDEALGNRDGHLMQGVNVSRRLK
jgi:hypothetical protein